MCKEEADPYKTLQNEKIMMNRSNEKSAQISMFWAEGGLNS
jgi:hypothetical protein